MAFARAAIGAVGLGAMAVGATALGALAIGALAIRALAVKRGRIERLIHRRAGGGPVARQGTHRRATGGRGARLMARILDGRFTARIDEPAVPSPE